MQWTGRKNNHTCQCVFQRTENKQGSCGLCKNQEVYDLPSLIDISILKTISRSLSVFVLVLRC
jgi:hypothetical protein